MKFCSLHHHSTFSFLDGYGLPSEHVERVTEIGMSAMALTEHGNVSSHVKLEKSCKEIGTVKPIFGCELYTGDVGENATQKKNHLTVLATDVDGYKNLLRLVSKGWSDGFYYEPTIDGSMLREYSNGLIALSGCSGSLLATSLVGGKNIEPHQASIDRARKVANTFRRILGDRYYLEVQAFPALSGTCRINQGIAQLSSELNIPLVATLDVHYPNEHESNIQQILHNVRGGGRKTLEEQARDWGYDVKLTLPNSDKELMAMLIGTGLTKRQASEAISNSSEIAERCNVVLPKLDPIRFPLPSGYADSVTLFRKMCHQGWALRGIGKRAKGNGIPIEKYQERIRREMALIESKDFVDYFLVVSDAVRFAKDNGIPVGPARGSAAGSLVCYLLRITEIDPVPFKSMVFDRFIAENRLDLPDIDLDFDDEMRYLVRDYLVGKYGADKVGNIGTFTTYKGRNSLDDVSRAMRIPAYETSVIKELLIERSSGDLRAHETIEDTVNTFPKAKEIFDRIPGLRYAMALEGNYRGMSTHAAGIVVANDPLTDACAIYSRNGSEVISLDKYDAEYLNVLKIDVLGLKTMAMIRIALEIIGMSLEDLYNIPLDDPETIQGFRDNDLIGIFQFDGRAMRYVTSKVKPDSFLEIADINALARPGPLNSGATEAYWNVKHGMRVAKRYNDLMDSITDDTYYQVVYQEQILRIIREIGNFNPKEASIILKIVGKSKGEEEFNRHRDRFISGAAENGIEEEQANEIFSLIATAGKYAFNYSHSVSYGMLGYWTMYLKVHYPIAFYVGALTKYEDKQMTLLRDLRSHGYKIHPIDPNESQITWSAEDDGVRPGFLQISGIGEKTAMKMLFLREMDIGVKTWNDLANIPGIGPKTISTIEYFATSKDPFGLDELENGIKIIRSVLKKGQLRHPDYDTALPELTHQCVDIKEIALKKSQRVVWCGRFTKRHIKKIELAEGAKDPHLMEVASFEGEDDTGDMKFNINRWTFPGIRDKCYEIDLDNDFVIVEGYRRGNQPMRIITVNDIWTVRV